ncbi:lamin tail domain-containing protein [Actinocorallia sp. API 0066]|uniref:lamin tail domain-containing protein n=1 Tax=Actinocorallia sp. API 0066 TaxID=2896846 RepID=UPI001E5D72F9|nr:lamin tail domain-containing protein [Actinocorallia sp. API 0066]MCD0448955.1 lamin tail domain-containing protein [Actinocorallia sp. API 0066]
MAVRDLVAVFLIVGVFYPSLGPRPSDSPGAEPSVRIERVHHSPRGSGGTWVELRNHAKTARDLRGWRLQAGGGSAYEFGPLRLRPGESVRVHTGSGSDSRTDVYWGRGSPVLPEGGATVTLRTPRAAVDACRYPGGGTTASC